MVKENDYRTAKGELATIKTTMSKVTQRATSKPRIEGIDARIEDTTETQDSSVEATSGSSSVHRVSRSRAVKKAKPFGVIMFCNLTWGESL